jgi:hypothetical protein
MSSTAGRLVGKAAVERVFTEEVGAPRAIAAAVVVGTGAAVLTYRFLRGSTSRKSS